MQRYCSNSGSAYRLVAATGAITAIRRHLERGQLDDGLIFDAGRARLIEIGETRRSRGTRRRTIDFLADVAGMRDYLAHRYFDISHGIMQATVDNDLPRLPGSVQRLKQNLAP